MKKQRRNAPTYFLFVLGIVHFWKKIMGNLWPGVRASALPLEDTSNSRLRTTLSTLAASLMHWRAGSLRSFTAIRKEAKLFCESFIRQGEVFAYVRRIQNLKGKDDYRYLLVQQFTKLVTKWSRGPSLDGDQYRDQFVTGRSRAFLKGHRSKVRARTGRS